ncbi:DUF7344 domain-containing protein [Halorubrum sp. DTA98]|uniref:DUF7344 domain-containing protein n=1 Tax=Halorubrum sp. DTA98 TaxID=3402163 RepID=UPI003AAF9AB5
MSELSLDVVFNVLRNQRRRLVLKAIEDHDGSTTLSDLAEHIGGIENDKPPAALNAQERKRVYVGLYQCHLPKMNDAGAVEFDKNRGTVERGPMADTYHTYLEREFESRRSWPRYYGGLTAVSSVALVAAVTLSSGLISIVFLATLVALASLAAYHRSCTVEQ